MRAPLLVFLASSALFLSSTAAAQEKPGKAPASTKLRVLTYNIWAIPYISKNLKERLALLPAAIAELKPDLVALQEVWHPEHASKLQSDLEAKGFKHCKRFEGLTGGGLLIASRYPLKESYFQSFTLRGDPAAVHRGDYYASKGVGVVSVETPVGPLIFANTHIHASYSSTTFHAEQLGQLLEISDVIGAPELRKPALKEWMRKKPLIVVGDFNRKGESLGIELLTRRSHLHAAVENQGIDAMYWRHGELLNLQNGPRQVVFTKKQTLPNGASATLSDHNGVLFEFTLTSAEVPEVKGEANRAWELVCEDALAVFRLQIGISQKKRIIYGILAIVTFALGFSMFRWEGRLRILKRLLALAIVGSAGALAYLTVHEHMRIEAIFEAIGRLSG